MTAVLLTGPYAWEAERDDEGHRTYKLWNRVETSSVSDGPASVMSCAGLPAIGSVWSAGNDTDIWAHCYPTMRVTVFQEKRGDPNKQWLVEQTFSTRPLNRCQDDQIEDPLLEPQKVSGSFVKYTQLISKDRNGDAILSSSHEPFIGPEMEFDFNRPTVRIEQNVATLDLATFSQMVDTVNSTALWGLSARCIKLSNVSWERNILGTCTYYYTRVFDFDIDFNTFDRAITDKGRMSLGRWKQDADGNVLDPPQWEVPAGLVKTNPLHFTRHTDPKGNLAEVLLDGNGQPIGAGASPATIDVEHYGESNFILLGIPTIF